MIRIANGQAFASDWIEAPSRLLAHGPIDYLLLHDVRGLAGLLAPLRQRIQDCGVRVLASVHGSSGPTSAFDLAAALAAGQAIVTTPPCRASALPLAAMIHAFQWTPADYHLLAAGAIGAHILSAGTQVTGGNTQVDWQTVPDPANIGYPILEVDPDGICVLTKHPGTGGFVNRHTVIEAMLTAVADPHSYQTPDCTADLTSVRIADCGPDRVRITGACGGPPISPAPAAPERACWQATGAILYSWPAALEKAYAADRILRERIAALGLPLDEIRTEFIGVNACHGPAAPPAAAHAEILLRVTARGRCREHVELFARQLAPIVTCGPPSGVLYERPRVRAAITALPAADESAEET